MKLVARELWRAGWRAYRSILHVFPECGGCGLGHARDTAAEAAYLVIERYALSFGRSPWHTARLTNDTQAALSIAVYGRNPVETMVCPCGEEREAAFRRMPVANHLPC